LFGAIKDGFEPLNATVQWTVADDGLTEADLNFCSIGTKNVTNLAGTSTDKRYLKCTRITKRKAHQPVCFSFWRNRTGRFEPSKCRSCANS